MGGWLSIMLLRHAARMNKLVLTMIVLVCVTTVGFQWIWERNEPCFLTPYINIVAPLFQSKNTF